MRRYIVSLHGWGPVTVSAETSAGAKARAYRALNALGLRVSFRDFLGRVSVRREHTVH